MQHWAVNPQADIGTPEFEVTQSGGGPCSVRCLPIRRQCRRRHAIEVLAECKWLKDRRTLVIGALQRQNIDAAPASNIVWRSR